MPDPPKDFIDVLDERTKVLYSDSKAMIGENFRLKSEFFGLYDTVIHFLERLGFDKSEIIKFQNERQRFYLSELLEGVENFDPEIAAELDQRDIDDL